jgi:hypothetical protein
VDDGLSQVLRPLSLPLASRLAYTPGAHNVAVVGATRQPQTPPQIIERKLLIGAFGCEAGGLHIVGRHRPGCHRRSPFIKAFAVTHIMIAACRCCPPLRLVAEQPAKPIW